MVRRFLHPLRRRFYILQLARDFRALGVILDHVA
jgi:hypothetical protein